VEVLSITGTGKGTAGSSIYQSSCLQVPIVPGTPPVLVQPHPSWPVLRAEVGFVWASEHLKKGSLATGPRTAHPQSFMRQSSVMNTRML